MWCRNGEEMCDNRNRRGVRVSGCGHRQGVWCRKGEVMCNNSMVSGYVGVVKYSQCGIVG